jgi:hypothetical protein
MPDIYKPGWNRKLAEPNFFYLNATGVLEMRVE